MNNCLKCNTEINEDERYCPLCHWDSKSIPQAQNTLSRPPRKARESGFPYKTKISPQPPNPEQTFPAAQWWTRQQVVRKARHEA